MGNQGSRQNITTDQTADVQTDLNLHCMRTCQLVPYAGYQLTYFYLSLCR